MRGDEEAAEHEVEGGVLKRPCACRACVQPGTWVTLQTGSMGGASMPPAARPAGEQPRPTALHGSSPSGRAILRDRRCGLATKPLDRFASHVNRPERPRVPLRGTAHDVQPSRDPSSP